ncbi:hypothetical protein ACN2XU_00305 [Primorskyibacter sp. 2E107]|uniref:hypothetical protein n=1 Tax=Primorskyibacter sp. 2E107 TaxID=3403458 RepID=UPI003AF90006
MKTLAYALVLTLGASASAAIAGVPTMTLPDLTFPPTKPDISTQGCVATVDGAPVCSVQASLPLLN